MKRLKASLWLAGWLLVNGCSDARSGTVYRSTTWSELGSFAYQPSVTPRMKSPAKPVVLPEHVRGLAGHDLKLTGYMMPVEVDEDRVKTFVLVKDQQLCCFGRMPAMNEWIFVTTAGGPVALNMDEPIEVEGRFEVGEDIQEGAVMSLYRMAADRVKLSEGKPKGWKAN